MPTIDGGDVAYQIKNNPETNKIPIMFLTAVVKEEEMQSNEGSIGGHPIIAKPVSVSKLIECIERNII